MKPHWKRDLLAVIFTLLGLAAIPRAQAVSLENDLVRADFDGHGLTLVHDKTGNLDFTLASDQLSATLNSTTVDSAALSPVVEIDTATQKTFR